MPYHFSTLTEVLQANSCTIALAVLTIYAVDFAINAGQSIKVKQAMGRD